MTDLSQSCAAMGLDSSKLRPIAHATKTRRIAVYIGACWQELPIGRALNLRDQIDRSIEQLQAEQRREAAAAAVIDYDSCTGIKEVGLQPYQQAFLDACTNDSPERFEVQLQQWREGIRPAPPTPELGEARAAELERRALADIAAEVQP